MDKLKNNLRQAVCKSGTGHIGYMLKSGIILFISVFILMFCVGAGTVTARANSAQTHFSGVNAAGAVLVGESPVVVENELLTLDVQDFPQVYAPEEFADYGGKVTAQYTFYNPSDYTVTSRLLFPFGKMPSYYPYYDYGDDGLPLAPDFSGYTVTADGAEVQTRVRHSLSFEYAEFDLERDLGYLSDGFVEDEFYRPDMTVTEYSFTAELPIDEDYSMACGVFEVAKGSDNAVIFDSSIGRTTERGFLVGTWLTPGETVTVCVAGEAFEPQWKVYENGSLKKETYGNMRLKYANTMTLEEYILQSYDESRGASKTDFYNAAVAYFNATSHYDGCRIALPAGRDLYKNMMRWYEYEQTFEPEGRIVNTVTAPIYPDIDAGWSPTVYKYTYLLSPAKTWKGFGGLKIVVNTPYYMVSETPSGFTKTEGGFELNLDGLPDGELEFTLSTEPNPVPPAPFINWPLTIGLIAAGVIVLLLVVAGITLAIVLGVLSKKKRSGRS